MNKVRIYGRNWKCIGREIRWTRRRQIHRHFYARIDPSSRPNEEFVVKGENWGVNRLRKLEQDKYCKLVCWHIFQREKLVKIDDSVKILEFSRIFYFVYKQFRTAN